MEGCREEKKNLRIWTASGVEKKHILEFWWEKIYSRCNIFPAKRQYIFQSTLDLIQEHRHFFPLGNHPYTKKLEKFPTKSLSFFLTLSKTKTITKTNKQIPFFPADGLSFVYANYKLLSKAHSVSNRKLAFAFSSWYR